MSKRDLVTLVGMASRKAAWAPIAVFTLHMLLSEGFQAYLAFPALDVPMHFAGGVAITYFLAYVVAGAASLGLLGRPNGAALLWLVLGASCSTTVFWEFAEFLSDRFLGTSAQVNLDDTLSDMLLGILGSLAYFAMTRWRLPALAGVNAGAQDAPDRDL